MGGEVVPAGEGELDLAVVHLGDQGPPALAGLHHLAPDDLDGVGPGGGVRWWPCTGEVNQCRGEQVSPAR